MITINGENFKKEVLESGIPVLIDFQAPWCGYCRRLAPAIDMLEKEYAGVVKVGTIDIDNDPELAEQFNVMTIPSLLLFRDGKLAAGVVNPGTRDAVYEWLKENGVQ